VSSDDPTEGPTPTSNSEEEEEQEEVYTALLEQKDVVKKTDYSLSEGVKVGDIFSVTGNFIRSRLYCLYSLIDIWHEFRDFILYNCQ
jgi:hypothetical protein